MKVNRFLMAGFAASVMINVFLASALFSQWLRGDDRPPRPPHPDKVVERLAGELSAADATLLRTAYARHRAEVADGFELIGSFPERVRAALAAEPFDPAALGAVFDANAQGHVKLTNALREATLDAVMAMSPEGRRTLARLKPRRPEDR